MSAEFEKIVLQKLNNIEKDVAELKIEMKEVKQDVAELKAEMKEVKQDVAELKAEMKEVKQDVAQLKAQMTDAEQNITELKQENVSIKATMKREFKSLKEDVTVLKNEMFNIVKPTLKTINQKLDIMININTAKILEGQTKNYNEQIKLLKQYENKNELEHSKMNYEICKLKANA